MRVELGSAADVPPTPTPLSRLNRSSNIIVQNDENAGVSATPLRTPAGMRLKLGLGGATPMRTPLASKSSLSNLGSKPVFCEEDEDEEERSSLPVIVHQKPAQPTAIPACQERALSLALEEPIAAVLATPIPLNRQSASRRWIEPMTEEQEEEEEEEEADIDVNDEPIENTGFDNNEHLFRPQFQPLTPITEATYEFTRYTNARTPGTATRSAICPAFKPWRDDEEEDEEDEISQGAILTTGPVIATRSEEGIKAKVNDDEPTDDEPTDERSFASTSAEDANRSAWNADNKASFELTKGLTIRCPAPEDDEEGNLSHDQPTRELHERFEDSLVIHDPDFVSQHEAADASVNSFSPPNPCSPVNPQVLNCILSQLPKPLESHPAFIDLTSTTSADLLAELQKKCKSALASNQMTRKSMGGTIFHGTGVLSSAFNVTIGGHSFEIRGKLGEGGYGAVFLGYDVGSVATAPSGKGDQDDPLNSDDEDEESDQRKIAIKVEAPANRWEFHILSKLHGLLPASITPSIVAPRKLYCYSDTSFLLLDLGEKGTLLDVVNHSVSAGVAAAGADTSTGSAGLEEVLAMFFVTQLLQVVLSMHKVGVIHGDLKIDNCLLRLSDNGSSWSNIYARDGSSGWSSKGVTLIDFGRAIDLSAYSAGQKFVADWNTDAKDCVEMRRGEPFTFETDWFGIAAVAHCLLFGRYMETKQDGAKFKIAATFKRYWQQEMWTELFDTCLNPKLRNEQGQPLEELNKDDILQSLEETLDKMQTWLEGNSNKGGKNLKGLLRKLEIWGLKQGH
nr:related to spindle assembly checkpoint protein [Melanopsichium pennsylvanicum 4]